MPEPTRAKTRVCTVRCQGRASGAGKETSGLLSPMRMLKTSRRILDSPSWRASGNGVGGCLCQGLLSS